MTKTPAQPSVRVGMRTSPLERHQRKGAILQSPANRLLKLTLSSWINDALPEVLWSTLLITALLRDDALKTFRDIAAQVHKHKEKLGVRRLEHSYLAELEQDTFDAIFSIVCQREPVRQALAPLLLFDSLPDRKQWSALLPQPDNADWSKIADAIAATFDHQSEQSTDCRWFKVLVELAKGKLHMPPEMEERFQEYIHYP